MKKVSLLISLLLVFVTVLGSLCGCSLMKNENSSNEKATYDNFIDIGIYKIIRPDVCDNAVIKSASNLKADLLKYTGADIQVAIDSDTESDVYEILVGKTDRKESADAYAELSKKKNSQALIIKVVGNKIVILGSDDNYTALAVKRFILAYVAPSKYEGRLSLKRGNMTKIGTAGEILTVGPDGQIVVLEKKSTVFDPDNVFDNEERTYPKIIKLENQPDPKNNGVLIATNENTKMRPWSLYRSKDDGETWEVLDPYRNDVATDASPGYQPYLFELPADVGAYKKGTVLFSACVYNASRTALIIAGSTDLGETWKGIGEIVEGGTDAPDRWEQDGVWEPVIIYDEETKRLYCFYSDESDPKYEQKLAYRYTTDLVNWSDTYSVTGDVDYGVGMVALTKMGNGKWALAFECCKIGEITLPVHIKYTDKIDTWNVPDLGKEVRDNRGVGLECAPSMVWSPAGGDKGVIVLCAYKGMRSTTGSKCDLFFSFDYGNSFVSVKNPLNVKKDDANKSSYSPGFYVDKEGAIYYINNPPLASGLVSGKLEMAKIVIY